MPRLPSRTGFLFSNDTPPPEISTLSLHDALPILMMWTRCTVPSPPEISIPPSLTGAFSPSTAESRSRSEEHTSELQSHVNLVCRLLLEKKRTPDKAIQCNIPRRNDRARLLTSRIV